MTNVFVSAFCAVSAITAIWVAWGFYGEFMTLTAWDRKAATTGAAIWGLLFAAWALGAVAVRQLTLFVG